MQKCKELVANYTNSHLDAFELAHADKIEPEDVRIVWYCKTLQNAKALLSTPLPDGMFYEITYNGDKDEIYFDAYHKVENIAVDVSGV